MLLGAPTEGCTCRANAGRWLVKAMVAVVQQLLLKGVLLHKGEEILPVGLNP